MDSLSLAQMLEEMGFDGLDISASMYGEYNKLEYNTCMYGGHA